MLPIDRDYALSLIDTALVHHVARPVFIELFKMAGKTRAVLSYSIALKKNYLTFTNVSA